MAKSGISNKNKRKRSLVINRTIDIVFLLVIIGLIIWEWFDTKNGSPHPNRPNVFNPDEAKFYVNNIVIILCPFIDSTIGIAFSAYNDRIYGLTIGQLKDIATYSGYSFLEIIIVSVILFALGIVAFYLDLLISDMVINGIALIYCILFIFMDVSLLARAKWHIYGIAKHRYNLEKKNFESNALVNVSGITMNFFMQRLEGNEYNKKQTKDFIDDFVKAKAKDESANKLKHKINHQILKVKRKTIINNREYLLVFEKYLLKGIKNISRKIYDYDKEWETYFDIINQLLDTIDKWYPKSFNMDFETQKVIIDYQISGILKERRIKYLSDELKLLMSNISIKDGFASTIKCFNLPIGIGLYLCLDLQKVFLDYVPNDDRFELELNLSKCFKNIKQFVCLYGLESKDIEGWVKNDLISFGQSIADCLIYFEEYIQKLDFNAEEDFDFSNSIKGFLPAGSRVDGKLDKNDIRCQKYYNVLTASLICKTSEKQKTWFYKEIVSCLSLNTSFYLFVSFYLHFIRRYKSGVDNDYKTQLDSDIRKEMSKLLVIILRPDNHPLSDKEMINILNDILNFYSCIPSSSWNYRTSNNLQNIDRHLFEGKTLIKYWLQLVDYFNCNFYLYSKFEDFYNILGAEKSETFIGIFWEYLNEREKDSSGLPPSYITYFNLENLKSKNNPGRSIESLKTIINNWNKNKLLSETRQQKLKNDTLTKVKRVFSLIESDLNSFALCTKHVNSSINPLSFSYHRIIDHNELGLRNTEELLYRFTSEFQHDLINKIFDSIYRYTKSIVPSHVSDIGTYDKVQREYLKKLPYKYKILQYDENDIDNIVEVDALCNYLGATKEIGNGVRTPYDIFFEEGAIEVNLEFSKKPIVQSLIENELDSEIAKSQNYKNGFYHCRQTNSAFPSNHVELTRDEYKQFISSQKVKVDFELQCSLEINPQKIRIFRRNKK